MIALRIGFAYDKVYLIYAMPTSSKIAHILGRYNKDTGTLRVTRGRFYDLTKSGDAEDLTAAATCSGEQFARLTMELPRMKGEYKEWDKTLAGEAYIERKMSRKKVLWVRDRGREQVYRERYLERKRKEREEVAI